jgi:hypothetical protein
MGCQGRSPAEGAAFLGTKETPEALIYLTPSVSCFNHVFIDAGEGIATALPHDERSRDKRVRADEVIE